MTEKIIVTGGRDFTNSAYIRLVLDTLEPDIIVQGGARGTDRIAAEWAFDHDKEIITILANWKEHGKSAGPRRNADMLIAHPDIKYVLMFPGGRVTGHMCDIAHKKGYTVMAATDWKWPEHERIFHG